ncbi:MAG: efflux RND transporter permease subunit [Gemmatimonadetes bacterium]|nr:efflux RND transporter permease subunit [Gemmatimonadota bacterium]
MKGAVAWFARNHVAANLLMMLILIGGLATIPSITQEVFPEMRPNIVTVTVPYPGAAPEEVERAICIRIEEAIADIEGIDKITSTATEGFGAVSAELVTGADPSTVLDQVKTVVDALDTFPDEAEKPIVEEVILKRQVIDVVISGDTDERTLKYLGEQVRDEIAALPGITQVDLAIARPYEVSIEVSETALRTYGLTFDEVASAVRRSSLDLPGGSVKTDGGEVLLRSVGQAYDRADFERIVVRSRPDGSRLLVGDVARVVDGFEDTGQEAYFDGRRAVMVQVFRVGSQRALDVSRRVNEYVEDKQAELPAGVHLTPWDDDAQILKSRLDLLIRNGRLGFVLVLAILSLFLKLRLAFWVALGIPISFMGAIWLMPTLDVSINLISLFAFIVVLGLAVDDAIVVGESIFTRMEAGEKGTEAAINGVHRVMRPVIFGILTTIAAFTPLFFIPGTMGQIWGAIPMIVIPVLVFSLIESLFILPAHLSSVKPRPKQPSGIRGRWMAFQSGFDRRLKAFISKVYQPFLELALRWRYVTLAVGVATLVMTIGLVRGGWVKFTFFPTPPGEDVVAMLTMPLGTPRDKTAEGVFRLQQAAEVLTQEIRDAHGEGAVKHVMTSVGEQPYQNNQRGPGAGSSNAYGEHLGEVNIQLAAMDEVEVDGQAAAMRWRELVGQIPDAVELTFASNLFQPADPINIQLASNDLDELRGAAARLREALANYSGVFDITDSFRSGKREMQLAIRPEAEALGLTLSDLARQVRQAFYGEEAQRIQRGRDDVKVMVRYPAESRRSLGDVEGLRIRAPGGIEVPFSTVAEVQRDRGSSSIRRADRRRVINVIADVDIDVANPNEVLASVVAADLPAILDEYQSVSYSFEGEQRQQSDTLSALLSGLAVALFAIFALLAVPLRSYTQPLIIMAAIPFGFVGAVWGHLIMGMNLTVLSIAGLVALSGVVVNDSLVMVDFVNRAREEGMSRLEAARTSGGARFRPILLTSLTTFAGISPLLLEKSLQSQFLKPLAVSLGFGVLFATALILVLVPTAYLILHDLHDVWDRFRNWLRGGRPTEEAAG